METEEDSRLDGGQMPSDSLLDDVLQGLASGSSIARGAAYDVEGWSSMVANAGEALISNHERLIRFERHPLTSSVILSSLSSPLCSCSGCPWMSKSSLSFSGELRDAS